VSASVTFDQFVRPALRKMMGHTRLFLPTLRARLDEPLTKNAGRLHFVRVGLEWRDREVWARTTGNQSSGVMTSLVRAHGLVVFPADATSLAAGEEVTVQVLDDDFFQGESPGFAV
jgi:molybdopterin molybdotransferase